MTPYYQDSLVTLYHGDARELVPQLGHFDSIITDPVWPNSIFPDVADPEQLLGEVLHVTDASRVVVQLGCDSDPRFLDAVPSRWPFIRFCLLEYARPSYKGRLVYGGDIAYVFGEYPAVVKRECGNGPKLIPGLCISTRSDARFRRSNWNGPEKRFNRDSDNTANLPHPAPRRLQHVSWLCKWFGGVSVFDPFIGSGTTAVACRALGIPCVGIDIKVKYLDVAIDRLRQGTLELTEVTA